MKEDEQTWTEKGQLRLLNTQSPSLASSGGWVSCPFPERRELSQARTARNGQGLTPSASRDTSNQVLAPLPTGWSHRGPVCRAGGEVLHPTLRGSIRRASLSDTPPSPPQPPPERCTEFENFIKASCFLGSRAGGRRWEPWGPWEVVLPAWLCPVPGRGGGARGCAWHEGTEGTQRCPHPMGRAARAWQE